MCGYHSVISVLDEVWQYVKPLPAKPDVATIPDPTSPATLNTEK